MAMAKHLFEIVRLEPVAERALRANKIPQMMEFPVNPELGPFLVSSTRSVLWVNKVSRDSRVRAAVRARAGLEQEIVASIVDFGTRSEWGNVHPLTSHGVAECVAHLKSYGFDEIEALVSSATSLDGITLGDLALEIADWMPIDCMLILPIDRSFVGTMAVVREGQVMCVVHNASRGMAVAWR
jgi:hypothetical protein